MGGFFLAKTESNTDPDELELRYTSSIEVFKGKGLTPSARLHRPGFTVFSYYKYSIEAENVLEFNDGGFVVSTGTCLYDFKIGAAALAQIYADFKSGKNLDIKLNGVYALIIFDGARLLLFTDYSGLYKVYRDQDQTLFSNSFMAVERALATRTIAQQEFYEYVLYGAFLGGSTVFKEIVLLDSEHYCQLLPTTTKQRRSIVEPRADTYDDFEAALSEVADVLVQYFDGLKRCYGDNVTSGLSGGYDSRLMLALMRNVGIKPKLYVYGSDESRDVIAAKTLTRGEDLPLEHVDRDRYPHISTDEFPEFVKGQFYRFDGFYNMGVFDNGADIATRLERAHGGALQLNGACGEIYRNYFQLPDRSISVRRFVRSCYAGFYQSMCGNRFDKTSYFENLESKVLKALGLNKGPLTRPQLEILFPRFRGKYWVGLNSSVNNIFSYALTPFAEPVIAAQSSRIPYSFKNRYQFEAALIGKLDSSLARYPSIYGHSFDERLPMRRRAFEFAAHHAPITIRSAYMRRDFNGIEPMPYYLQDEYLGEIFDFGALRVSDYVDVRKIKSPGMLSRALTVELHFLM